LGNKNSSSHGREGQIKKLGVSEQSEENGLIKRNPSREGKQTKIRIKFFRKKKKRFDQTDERIWGKKTKKTKEICGGCGFVIWGRKDIQRFL